MYRYADVFAVETVVEIADADQLVALFCINFRDFIVSSDLEGTDTVVDFGEGKATLRPTIAGLRIRIVSHSLLGYLGCRELLRLHLADRHVIQDEDYIWMPASEVPFAILDKPAGIGSAGWTRMARTSSGDSR